MLQLKGLCEFPYEQPSINMIEYSVSAYIINSRKLEGGI